MAKKNSTKTARVVGTPFPPGVSGNPNGRPLGQRNYSTIYKEALKNLADLNNKTPDEIENEIIKKGLTMAIKGSYQFYKDIQDRMHGKAAENLDITTKGQAIVFMPAEIMEKFNLKNATDSSPSDNS